MVIKCLYEPQKASESLYMTVIRNTHFIGRKTNQRRNINVWSDYKILQRHRGYGFIQSMTNGETYFIHKKDLNGEYVRTGSVVYFSHYKSKNRKNNAVILNVIENSED